MLAGLVDAYEVISAVIFASRVIVKDKIALAFQLYDFNGTGEISLDEIVLLIRTALSGTSKLDSRVELWDTNKIESYVRQAFEDVERDPLEDLNCDELYSFFAATPMISCFLDYWDG